MIRITMQRARSTPIVLVAKTARAGQKRFFGSGRGKGGSLIDSYSKMLETNPLVTKIITSAAIVGTGDVM